MTAEFEKYQDRKIEFIKNTTVNDFHVKVYTITNKPVYQATEALQASINNLPDWLKEAENSTIATHKHAFLIVHEAREGVLVLLNWWTGENMVETKIYFAEYSNPTKVEASLYHEKQLVCIWELEIFYYERKAWIQHVLSKAENPDFTSYINSYYQQEHVLPTRTCKNILNQN